MHKYLNNCGLRRSWRLRKLPLSLRSPASRSLPANSNSAAVSSLASRRFSSSIAINRGETSLAPIPPRKPSAACRNLRRRTSSRDFSAGARPGRARRECGALGTRARPRHKWTGLRVRIHFSVLLSRNVLQTRLAALAALAAGAERGVGSHDGVARAADDAAAGLATFKASNSSKPSSQPTSRPLILWVTRFVVALLFYFVICCRNVLLGSTAATASEPGVVPREHRTARVYVPREQEMRARNVANPANFPSYRRFLFYF